MEPRPSQPLPRSTSNRLKTGERGDTRGTQPSSDITDRGFTGHRENRDIGLTYMNARYYVPEIGRFASADTLVPDPQNPQSFNRYSYVVNRPTILKDPTGHAYCTIDGSCERPHSRRKGSPLAQFVGDGWTHVEQQVVHQATRLVANQMARAFNQVRRFESVIMDTVGSFASMSATAVFRGVFGGPVTFNRTSVTCPYGECVAWVNSGETIVNGQFSNVQLVIHEIFHVFDLTALGGVANQAWAGMQEAYGSAYPDRPDLDRESDKKWGFAGPNFSDWQKSRSGDPAEEFADMGIGWTYAQWDTTSYGRRAGRARADFMNNRMGMWVSLAINGGR